MRTRHREHGAAMTYTSSDTLREILVVGCRGFGETEKVGGGEGEKSRKAKEKHQNVLFNYNEPNTPSSITSCYA
jgi:hypothetical protein